MKSSKQTTSLHPKNLHQGRYDLDSLSKTSPELATYIFQNEHGNFSLDFADAAAVKLLNRALLIHFYGIRFWDIPDGFLCPPIPGRADYIHYAADLLAESNSGKPLKGSKIQVLDIGCGANLIYPLLANAIYGWRVVGSELNPKAIESAQKIIEGNPHLIGKVEVLAQTDSIHIFKNIITSDAFFDLTICNPPFHDSAQSASEGSIRKLKNLRQKPIEKVDLNFGGQASELWCPGGELEFIRKMILESISFRHQVFWFTSLVSKSENLKAIEVSLRKVGVVDFKIIKMAQGNKKSRFVAWTFLDPKQQKAWQKSRWA
jgi:23S rRNA (adenine1618-N6)-methyltransferase